MTPRWQIVKPQRPRTIVWGAGDQGRVNIPILNSLGCEIAAFVDDTPDIPSPLPGVSILRGWAELEPWLSKQDVSALGFVLAIGNPYGHIRRILHSRLTAAGLTAVSFADESAFLCTSSTYGIGLQVMPMAMVNYDAVIGIQCILNSRCLVEHDCVLEDGVEIGPAATLCGRVHVGENSWIGAGATVRQRITIGKNVIVGVGAAVVMDIPDNVVAVGVPARLIAGRQTPSAIAGVV